MYDLKCINNNVSRTDLVHAHRIHKSVYKVNETSL